MDTTSTHASLTLRRLLCALVVKKRGEVTMSVISRYRWRISIRMPLIFSGFILALVFALSVGTIANAASLLQISSAVFTNTTRNHKTEVEPDTFAFGNTIVSAFQQGRFFNGGGSDIGFATSTNGGVTWVHGSLPGVTVNSTPAGPYLRASDASVAFDAKPNVWLISSLGIKNPPTGPFALDFSRPTDGGRRWGRPLGAKAR